MEIVLHRAGRPDLFDKTSRVHRYDYHHFEQNGFGALSLLNETIIEPLGSFSIEPHRNMEIITIVTEGTLAYREGDGDDRLTHAGQIQYISAGHHHTLYEYNASAVETTHLLQFGIIPNQKPTLPRYEQRDCDMERFNRWAQIISGNGKKNSLRIMQDVSLRVAHLFLGHTLVSDPLKSGYGRLLFVLDGEVNACGHRLKRRDELQVIGNDPFEITANKDARLFLLDVPMDNFEAKRAV